MDGFKYAPSATRYHNGCCKVGAPFTTRLKKDEGMILPASVAEMKNSICEACTVRSVCHRELEDTKEDETLLRLERMRIIDLASYWSNGTYQQYKTKYKVIRKFELYYQLSIWTPRDMDQLPNDADIPLMWAQEKYALSIPK
jgi:hypothetical protein